MSINHFLYKEVKPRYDIYVNNIDSRKITIEEPIDELKFKTQNSDVVNLSSLPDHGLPSQRLTSNGNGSVSWVSGSGTSGIEYDGAQPVQLGKLAKYNASDGSLVNETSFVDTDILLKDGSVPLTGNLFLNGNSLFNAKTITGNGVDEIEILNSGGTRIFVNNHRIQASNDIEMQGNIRLESVNNQELDINLEKTVNNVKIPIGSIRSDAVDDMIINSNNKIILDSEVKINNVGLDMNNNNILNTNFLQVREVVKATGEVAVIYGDDIDMANFDINNINELTTTSINGLTPVGGLYSGISDGVVINQASGQSDILPTSSVGSLNIPANGFQVGDAYHLVVAGTFPTETKNDEVKVEIKQNGTLLGSVTLEYEDFDTSPSNFELEADFIIRSTGVTGSLATNIDFTFNKKVTKDFKGTRSTSITTLNTTTVSTLSVLATITGAGSSIQSTMAYLRKQY